MNRPKLWQLYLLYVAVCVFSVAAASQSEAVAPKKPVTVSFVTWRGDDSDAYDRIIAAFEEKNPTIKVNAEYLGKNYDQIVSSRGVAGELEFFAANPGTSFPVFAKAGYGIDIAGQTFLDDCIPGAVAAGTLDGKTYGVSQATSLLTVFYNKAKYEESGLTVPRTWDEFITVCETLKGNGTTPLVNGFGQIHMAGNPAKMMIGHYDPEMAPGWYLKLYNKEMTLNDGPFPTVLSGLKQMWDGGYYIEGVEGIDKHGAAAVFAQQKTAMSIEGGWRANTIAKTEGAPDFGVFSLPAPGSRNEQIHIVHPNQLHMIFPGTEKEDELLAFYAHMMSKDMATIYSSVTNQVPTVKGVQVDSPIIGLLSDYIGSTRPVLGPNLANPSAELEGALRKAYTRAALGEDLKVVVKDIQKEIDNIER